MITEGTLRNTKIQRTAKDNRGSNENPRGKSETQGK